MSEELKFLAWLSRNPWTKSSDSATVASMYLKAGK